jgi:drug/metabolite transporter (DMT)-like permease
LAYHEEHNKAIIARIYICLSLLAIGNVHALVKATTAKITAVLYLRSLSICLVNILFLSKNPSEKAPSRELYFGPKRSFYLCLLFSFVLTVQTPFFFMGNRMIPLGEVNVLVSTNTIMGQLFAVYLLGESFTWNRLRNILISICGLILIVRPPILFGEDPI